MSFADQVTTRRAALDDRHRHWQPRTLAAMLDSVADHYPEQPFVITEQCTLSYAELAVCRRGWPAGWPPAACGRVSGSGCSCPTARR